MGVTFHLNGRHVAMPVAATPGEDAPRARRAEQTGARPAASSKGGDVVSLKVADGVVLSVDTATGRCALTVGGVVWASGVPPAAALASRALSLVPGSVSRASGTDRQGSYDAVSMTWTSGDGAARADAAVDVDSSSSGTANAAICTNAAASTDTPDVHVVTEFAVYATSAANAVPAVRFTQRFPLGVANASAVASLPRGVAGTGVAFVAFPAFNVSASEVELNALAFNGCQIQFSGAQKWSSFRGGGGQQSMPVVLYNRSLTAVALGPLDNFFTAVHETASAPGVLAAGFMATVGAVPAGSSFSTLLVPGVGVNSTLFGWGTRLLRQSGKARPDPYKSSFVLSHLGYWVDNGATYYHSTAGYNASEGMQRCVRAHNCTQEAALLAVRDAARRQRIPLRYFQWDDWAPLDWTWPPHAFPDGATHWLGPDPRNASRPMPLSLYHGLWGGGRRVPALAGLNWSADGSLPLDERFFALVLANGTEAGMVMFEQDYICDSLASTSRVVGTGEAWFRALDAAAAAAGVDVQLCMMNPAHALASTLVPTATNGRATGDHVVRNAERGLVLGTSSMLLFSVGLWPSRDNVWTNSSEAVPGMNPERTPVLQTVMAVLAGGPYGPSDLAGAANASLIASSCRSDGVLLRPSKPATTADAAWAASFDDMAPRHVAVAFAAVGARRWSLVLGINLDAAFDVPAAELLPGDGADVGAGASSGSGGRHQSGRGGGSVGDGDAGRSDGGAGNVSSAAERPSGASATVFVAWHHDGLSGNAATGPFVGVGPGGAVTLPACPQIDTLTPGWVYVATAPVMPSGWVLLGELGKVVPVSARRFARVASAEPEPLTASVAVAPGESVVVSALPPGERVTPVTATCTAPPRAHEPSSGAAGNGLALDGERVPPSSRASGAAAGGSVDVDVAMSLACSGRSCTCQ